MSNHKRLTRTIYRQLLRWCQATTTNAPAPPLHLPPLTLTAPSQINAYATELLFNPVLLDPVVEHCRQLLPRQTLFHKNQLTIPLSTVTDLKQTVRAIFRLNHDEYDDDNDEYQRKRTTLALEALKSLNQLNSQLEYLTQQRELHQDRTHVQYQIGDVIQHQHERWRGVIVGWSRPPHTVERNSSLTMKDYTDDQAHIQYEIVLDIGDAHTLGSPTGRMTAVQADLEKPNHYLSRIRNRELENCMIAYNHQTNAFVPDEQLQYQYPADKITPRNPVPTQLCTQMIEAAQTLASRLERCILDETSAPQTRGLNILANVQERLRSILQGDVLASDIRFKQISLLTQTTAHLQALLNLNLEILDVNNQRKLSQETCHNIKFKLGQVVQHKVFGFRGVIVAWDAKPTIDVSRWDGLQHIENPMEQPFYHVIPDQNDCIREFGGERSLRYVCQENLEECPESKRVLNVDLTPAFTKLADGNYLAPIETRYKYGDDIEDDGVTQRCLHRLQDEFNSWFLRARESNSEDEVVRTLSTDQLTELLKHTETMTEAGTVQELIKEFRKAHPQREMRRRLDFGVGELLSGRAEKALNTFKQLISEDPTYAEAWNKAATCEFMQGKHDDSLRSTERVLELEPDHAQAIGGLGLLYFESEEYDKAIENFEKAIKLDPWSLVAPKLSITYDIKNRLIEREELPNNKR